MPDIRRIGIVGCGVMGSGIAAVCAWSGLDVLVAVTTKRSLDARRHRIAASLEASMRKGKISQAERDAAENRVAFCTEISALHDRDLVIEAIAEDRHAKIEVFRELDKVLGDPAAILATTTSAIPVSSIAKAVERPERVVGMHFFNPVTALPLVELAETLSTSGETGRRAEEFLTTVLGKEVIRVPDRAGYLVNSLLVPYLLAAIRLLESGVASAADIDRAMVLGCAHPVGPLKLADIIGLDTLAVVSEALYAEFKQPAFATPPLLSRMVDAGRLGAKSGHGFHPPPPT
ncbi:MAG TPA: 3-hydroxybutyryl-CoA dehydrogenase [Amycolatopsis sp.]|jgi:3-hydroxybutyryl-CoA dehydrogenase|nr:3-hydroxybutyryl-CoA dehydrogenase [Amycolatopsis sp.]